LYLNPMYPDMFSNLIRSILRWTPLVKKFHFGCTEKYQQCQQLEQNQKWQQQVPLEPIKFFPDENTHLEILKAVRENFHLHVVDLDIDGWNGDHDLERSQPNIVAFLWWTQSKATGCREHVALAVGIHRTSCTLPVVNGRDLVYHFLRQSVV